MVAVFGAPEEIRTCVCRKLDSAILMVKAAIAKTEADHFATCPGCGQWFDLRDLDQILVHFHDAEIEISEGPEPPPPKGVQ